MVTLATPARSRLRLALSLSVPARVWLAIIGSRLLVLASGAAGALYESRASGWESFDPLRLSSSLGSVGNVLAASSVRWDAIGYLTIAQHGYTDAKSTMLFPLYPMLIRMLDAIVPSQVICGEMISLTAFAVGLELTHRIAADKVGPRAADMVVLLLAFSPLSFVFSAVYTESLMLALAAATFYLASRDRFEAACLAATAAALTHVQGILLVAPLALTYWRARGRPRDPRRLASAQLALLAFPPLAFASFLEYMHAHGWGWLAPIANQNAADAGRTFVGPGLMLFDAVKAVAIGIDQLLHPVPTPVQGGVFSLGLENTFLLAVLTISILGAFVIRRRLPGEYVLFAVLALLVCTSSAVALEPLKGFDRYMLPVFPLWIGAGAWLSDRRLGAIILPLSTMMLVCYTVAFASWVSVF